VSPPASEDGGHARPRRPLAPGQALLACPRCPCRRITRRRDAAPPSARQRRRQRRRRRQRQRPAGPARGLRIVSQAWRTASPARRRAKRSRLTALAIVVVAVIVTGLATGFGSEPSAEPTAQAFLLDWQQQQYGAAAALTTAAPDTVAADLKGAFAQVDATQLFLSMNSVVAHGAPHRRPSRHRSAWPERNTSGPIAASSACGG